MDAIKLLPCPFCGGQAMRKEVKFCLSRGFQVYCVKCHASACAYYMGFDPLTGKDIPEEQASVKAAKVWNSRRETA